VCAVAGAIADAQKTWAFLNAASPTAAPKISRRQ
jgi:hypothetical protein